MAYLFWQSRSNSFFTIESYNNQELVKLWEMVIDVTVKCDSREDFIYKIQQLDEATQTGLMKCIQNNELLLKLTKDYSLTDEQAYRDRDSSIYQILTFNTKSMDNISHNCSFTNFDKLGLNGSIHINHSMSQHSALDEDSKDTYDAKTYEELVHRIQVLERENKIYKTNQNDMASRNKELNVIIKKLLKDKKQLEKAKQHQPSSESKAKLSKEALDYISGLELELDQTKTHLEDLKNKHEMVKKQLKQYEDQMNDQDIRLKLQDVLGKQYILMKG